MKISDYSVLTLYNPPGSGVYLSVQKLEGALENCPPMSGDEGYSENAPLCSFEFVKVLPAGPEEFSPREAFGARTAVRAYSRARAVSLSGPHTNYTLKDREGLPRQTLAVPPQTRRQFAEWRRERSPTQIMVEEGEGLAVVLSFTDVFPHLSEAVVYWMEIPS